MKKLLILLSCLFLASCSRPATPHFQSLKVPKTYNYYIVCPPKYCNVTPNAYSPVYPASADDLFNAFNQIITTEPRTNFIYSIPQDGEFILVVRTPLGLPSMVTVQFIALDNSSSTIAIYSQSYYGIYDFGLNRYYVNKWIKALNRIYGVNGTEGRNRTDTVSPPPDFESGASTSSATPA